MLKILFFLFIAVPLLELYLLIEVGSGIGGIPTILLCLFTAALGGVVIRWQGIRTLLSAQQQLLQGALPAEHVFHGILLAVAGLLLFLPGLITDTFGFLLLIPAIRRVLIRHWISKRMSSHTDNSRDTTIIDAEIIEVKNNLK